jgi:hypothetical protein
MTHRPPDEIYRDIGQAFHERCPSGWLSGRIICRQVGTMSEYMAEASMPDGSVYYPTRVSRTFGPYFDELRDLFAQPGKGTWFTAVCTLSAEGRFSLDLDYDHEPEWQTPVSAGHYLEDWSRYPREPATTPAWLTAKLVEARG